MMIKTTMMKKQMKMIMKTTFMLMNFLNFETDSMDSEANELMRAFILSARFSCETQRIHLFVQVSIIHMVQTFQDASMQLVFFRVEKFISSVTKKPTTKSVKFCSHCHEVLKNDTGPCTNPTCIVVTPPVHQFMTVQITDTLRQLFTGIRHLHANYKYNFY